jgi:glycosyltransferase involved in cell wall biosynthesis
MNQSPEVSIVMSVYNGEPYLHESIESILDQTFTDFEFIIIDDGSTDNSRNIIEMYEDKRIKLFSQENRGLAKSLNWGISKARGKYIARMDADDFSFPDRLEKQFSFLEENPNCVASGTNADIIDEENNFVYTSKIDTDWLKIKEKLPIIPFFHSSVIFRKDIFFAVEGYPENMLRAQDLVLFNKMTKHGQLRNLEEVLIKYRIVSNSLSMEKSKKTIKFLMKLIIKSLNNEDLTDEEIYKFRKMVSKNKFSFNKHRYHNYLAKKYLWNNYQPSLARKNLIKSLEYAPLNPETYLLICLTIFPRNLVKKLYNKLKKPIVIRPN